MSNMLDWALYYASIGLSVIPVKDKLPLIRWKEFQERKANEEEIKTWWTQWPEADIGMVTGRITKRLVLDIDGPEGYSTCETLGLPITLTVKTKRGYQLHLRYPDVANEAKTTLAGLLPSVDTRGNGGYVKLPPSQFSDGSGRYEWIGDMNTPLADAPQWLLDKLSEKKQSTSLPSQQHEYWIADILSGVGEGQRHQALCKLFGYYANTMPLGVAAAHIREWNSKNTPPYDDKELESQISNWINAFKRGEYQSNYKEPVNNTNLISFNVDVNKYLDELKERSKHLKPEFSTGFNSLDRITKGFPKQNLYVIGAPTNGGKTQFVLSCIHSLIEQDKKVLYFSTEMPQNEIIDRFNAIGAKIPLKDLRDGYISNESKDKLVKFLQTAKMDNFIISPEDTPTLESITLAIEKSNPDIIILDHIHHIKMSGDSRRLAIDDFVMGLKKIILQKDIPCVVTAQLRRKSVEEGKAIHYTMHDFKESGGIENEAGVCLLLCPPDKWTTDRFQRVTAYVPKNRHGRREVRFNLEFDTEVCDFRESTIV